MSKKKRSYEALKTDLTPMIDVCFLLIIFFMLILSIKQVYGIAIKFPFGKPPQQKKEKEVKPILIWVGPDNYDQHHNILTEGYLKLNGEPIALASSEDSLAALEEHDKGMKYLREKLQFFQENRKVLYDTVMNITGEVNSYHGKIVEVIDQGKRAGVKGFSLVPPRVR